MKRYHFVLQESLHVATGQFTDKIVDWREVYVVYETRRCMELHCVANGMFIKDRQVNPLKSIVLLFLMPHLCRLEQCCH